MGMIGVGTVLTLLTLPLCASVVFEPLLFMAIDDVVDPWGLIWPTANTVQPSPAFKPPPLNFSQGDLVIGVIASATVPGQFEVYAENTTGKEPIYGASAVRDNPTHATNSQLLRFTTTDFNSYSPAKLVLALDKGGTPTMKSVARSDNGSLYVLFTVYPSKTASYSTFVSRDYGVTWAETNTTGVVRPDKDDLNLIFNKGRFVDMQIIKQVHTPESDWDMKYCDNDDSCLTRRVVSAKTSTDGAAWGPDAPLIVPDKDDPPELQFYRMRPFYVGRTRRVAGASRPPFWPQPPSRQPRNPDPPTDNPQPSITATANHQSPD